MKCLIVGGGGFMGSHLSEALLAAGHEVCVFDRPQARWLEHSRKRGASIITGDYQNAADFEAALSNCDVLYHLAADTVPLTSNESPGQDVQSNLVGTLRLLDAARKARIRKIVFPSSGGTVYGVPQELPIRETHPTDPISSYGITKLAVEKYLHLYWVLHKLDYCILRIANAYGERQPTSGPQGVIGTFLAGALRGETLTMWGDGSGMRDYVYISDVADALARAALDTGEHRVFNIGGGLGHSLNEIVELIEQLTKVALVTNRLPLREFDVPTNVLDIDRARAHLHWEPKVAFAEGVARVHAWISRGAG